MSAYQFSISRSRTTSMHVVASAMLKACSITTEFVSGLCGSCSVTDTRLSHRLNFGKRLSSECDAVFKSRLGERNIKNRVVGGDRELISSESKWIW